MNEETDPWWTYAIVGSLMISPIIGIGMYLYTDNVNWMALAVTIFFFLS